MELQGKVAEVTMRREIIQKAEINNQNLNIENVQPDDTKILGLANFLGITIEGKDELKIRDEILASVEKLEGEAKK